MKGVSIGGGVNLFLDVFANIDAYVPHFPDINELLSISSVSDLQSMGISFLSRGYLNEPYTIKPLAGIQYKLTNHVTLGFVYRSKFYSNVDADAYIHLRSTQTDKDYVIPAHLSLKTFYDPDQYCVGGEWRVSNKLKLLIEGDYNRWSQYIYPFLNAKISPQAMGNFINEYLGDLISTLSPSFSSSITSLTSKDIYIGMKKEEKEKLKDTLTLRVGSEWKPTEKFAFDFGYAFDQNPVASQSKATNLLSATTHIFSFAAFYEYMANTYIGFHVQYQYLVSTHYSKDSTYKDFNDPEADLMNRVSNPGYPGYEVGGGYLNIGLTVFETLGKVE